MSLWYAPQTTIFTLEKANSYHCSAPTVTPSTSRHFLPDTRTSSSIRRNLQWQNFIVFLNNSIGARNLGRPDTLIGNWNARWLISLTLTTGGAWVTFGRGGLCVGQWALMRFQGSPVNVRRWVPQITSYSYHVLRKQLLSAPQTHSCQFNWLDRRAASWHQSATIWQCEGTGRLYQRDRQVFS